MLYEKRRDNERMRVIALTWRCDELRCQLSHCLDVIPQRQGHEHDVDDPIRVEVTDVIAVTALLLLGWQDPWHSYIHHTGCEKRGERERESRQETINR